MLKKQENSKNGASPGESDQKLSEMIDNYKQAKGNDEETAVDLRHSILQKLKENPQLLEQRDYITFDHLLRRRLLGCDNGRVRWLW